MSLSLKNDFAQSIGMPSKSFPCFWIPYSERLRLLTTAATVFEFILSLIQIVHFIESNLWKWKFTVVQMIHKYRKFCKVLLLQIQGICLSKSIIFSNNQVCFRSLLQIVDARAGRWIDRNTDIQGPEGIFPFISHGNISMWNAVLMSLYFRVQFREQFLSSKTYHRLKNRAKRFGK